ncbi:AAA family ATPase [Roseisolibacter agri]|nr:AAA family ATPase [Roseisolibacter agri]
MHPNTEVRFGGYWQPDSAYGPQLTVVTAQVTLPSEAAGVVRYLKANIAGLERGVTAKRIAVALGSDCLARLKRDPALVQSLVPGGRGIALRLEVEAWAAEVRRETVTDALARRLHEVGVERRTVCLITRYFRTSEAAEVVTLRQPYRLLDVPGVAWETADKIARALGAANDDPARLNAACDAALQKAYEQGHTAVPPAAVAQAAAGLVKPVPVERLEAAVHALAEGGVLVRVGERVARPAHRATEWRIAEGVARMLDTPAELTSAQRAALDAMLAQTRLTSVQRGAVRLVLGSHVSVLTGGPGCGKTTTLRAVVEGCHVLGLPVRVLAPTGKAASRAKKVTGDPNAGTVHRFIASHRRAGGGERPGVVVVDESSMCDAETAAALLGTLDLSQTRLVWCGDADQLPSVGAGQVLLDLVRSGRVPVARLTDVFRMSAESRIHTNARCLLAGQPLDLSDADDFGFIPVPEDERAAVATRDALLSELARLEATGVKVRSDAQVLVPVRPGPLGVDALNRLLQDHLNPRGEPGPLVGGGTRARVGDRIVITRNIYELPTPVFNGEQGEVLAVDGGGRDMLVRVDDREVVLRGVQCLMTRLAWAITVHRSQGSEYPYVLMAYHHLAHRRLLDPRVLYTALTRAQNRFVLVGTEEAVSASLAQTGAADRQTMLPELLARAAGRPAPHPAP